MPGMLKKYLPYLLIIAAVYMLFPLAFLPEITASYSPVAYDFVFPLTAIACSAHYCAKHGLDFLFALIAPIIFLPSMLIYNGGFVSTNLILLVVYLVAGIFGLFLGDLAFGDKRRAREKNEQQRAEERMLEAKRREREELERMSRPARPQQGAVPRRRPAQQAGYRPSGQRMPQQGQPQRRRPMPRAEQDDFNYDKYTSAIDRKSPTESEIDDILSEYGH